MPTALDVPWSCYQRLPAQKPATPLQVKVPCPFCGGDDAGGELLRLDDFQCFEDRDGCNRITHRVVFCKQCGQVHTDPWLTRDAARGLLAKAGASYGHCDPEERVAWVLSRVPGVRSVLDLGCGDGSLLGGFPPSLDRYGIDSDAHLVSIALKTHKKITFRHHDLEDAFEIPQADVIMLFHLLEHVTDPRNLLTRIRQAAAETTRLVVEVPILDRAIETQGPDLCGFFSIPHRTHFSRHTLDRMLSHCGWQVEQRTDLAGNGYRVLARRAEPVRQVAEPVQVERERRLALEYAEYRRNSIAAVCEILQDLPERCNIMIWGAGHHTEFLAALTPLFTPQRRFVIVDRDPLKTGMRIHGIPVLTPDAVPAEYWREGEDRILISSYTWQHSIYQGLVAKGTAPCRIFRLYP